MIFHRSYRQANGAFPSQIVVVDSAGLWKSSSRISSKLIAANFKRISAPKGYRQQSGRLVVAINNFHWRASRETHLCLNKLRHTEQVGRRTCSTTIARVAQVKDALLRYELEVKKAQQLPTDKVNMIDSTHRCKH